MIFVDYYEVSDDFSEDGRSGQTKIIGRFSKEAVANEFAKGRGNYGHDAHVNHESFWVAETLGEINRIKDVDDRERALAKLTVREKKLLGIIK